MSRVTCHMSHDTFFFFWQSGEAYWWRVCYRRGLPRLVFPVIGFLFTKQFQQNFSNDFFYLIIFCDHVITILNHSLMTKKHLLCSILIVQILFYMWIQRGLLFICCVYCSISICVSHLNLLKLFFLVSLYIPGKNRRGGGWWFGTAKNGDFFICTYMLIRSLLFLSEHLFVFIFYALMPKIPIILPISPQNWPSIYSM